MVACGLTGGWLRTLSAPVIRWAASRPGSSKQVEQAGLRFAHCDQAENRRDCNHKCQAFHLSALSVRDYCDAAERFQVPLDSSAKLKSRQRETRALCKIRILVRPFLDVQAGLCTGQTAQLVFRRLPQAQRPS